MVVADVVVVKSHGGIARAASEQLVGSASTMLHSSIIGTSFIFAQIDSSDAQL